MPCSFTVVASDRFHMKYNSFDLIPKFVPVLLDASKFLLFSSFDL
jgi:hypothetical protein